MWLGWVRVRGGGPWRPGGTSERIGSVAVADIGEIDGATRRGLLRSGPFPRVRTRGVLGWLVGFDDGGVVGLRLGEVGGLVEGVDVHLEIKGIAVREIWWNVMRIEDRGIGWSSGLAAGPVVGGNDGRIVYEVFGGSGDVRGVWTVWALLVPFWYLRTSAPGICFGLGSNEAELGSRWSWR